jgi:hypothetical protein
VFGRAQEATCQAWTSQQHSQDIVGGSASTCALSASVSRWPLARAAPLAHDQSAEAGDRRCRLPRLIALTRMIGSRSSDGGMSSDGVG